MTRAKITTTAKAKIKQAPDLKTIKKKVGADKVDHGVKVNLIGKGATARVHTTHTIKYAEPGLSHTLQHTYGTGKGRINLNYTHRVNRSIVSQHSANVNVRKVALGGAAAYGGYKAYQHRDQIKQKAQNFGGHVQNAFHSTHQNLH